MSDLRRYASRFAALGHEVRLRILSRLRRAHPDGMVVGDIQQEIGVPASTLSHHLQGLEELLHFLDAECCPRTGEQIGFGRKTAT